MYSVTSKNGRLKAEIFLDGGQIYFVVSKDGEHILLPSKLGIVTKQTADIAWELKESKTTSHSSVWTRIWGQSSAPVIDEYNELTVAFIAQNTALEMKIVLRCYDDGMAIRYVFDKQPTDYINITKELTEYNFTDNYMLWFADNGLSEQKMNDGGQRINEVSKATTPITIKKSDNCYICLHEADLYRYEEAVFNVGQQPNSLAINTRSISALPHQSPWRLMLVCDSLNELITSSTIENLNPPSKLVDTSYIKTGKCMWDWRNHGAKYDDFTYGMNTESMKRYIDFAAENNIQYALIDGNWHPDARDIKKVNPIVGSEGVDIEEICRYGVEKGVGMWLYINDEAFVYLDIDMILATYKNWGAVGIKHGFIATRGQRRSEDTIRLADKCAQYGLMYNPHEPERPWGMHRTYPNMICTEFVNAQYDGPAMPETNPTALTIIPFTNCLTAPVDRACGMFDIDNELERDRCHRKSLSTIASQLSQCITEFTGLLVLPDNPHAYNKKQDLFEFIREMPPMTWDETKLLTGVIGEHVTIARRSGDAWFIGAQTNEYARKLSFEVDFLGEGEYQMTLYADADDSHYIHNREAYNITKTLVKNGDAVDMELACGGGCAIWIRK